MTSLKRTPGPWVVSNDKSAIATSAPVGGDIVCLAPEGWPDSMANWPGNAKVLAAALDLLDACIAVNKCGNGGAKLSRAASDKVRAALKKAGA